MPKKKKPLKSFASEHPELLIEWDYENNRKLGYEPETTAYRSSTEKLYWICTTCKHRWRARALQRSYGNGCPKCGRQRQAISSRIPPKEKSLAAVDPLVANDWHPTANGSLTPADIYANSDKRYSWLCKNGHEQHQTAKRRRKNVHPGGCSICGGRSVHAGFNDLATTHPHLISQWHYGLNDQLNLKITQVSAGSERKAHWKCEAGHTEYLPVKQRVRNVHCSQCRLIMVSKIEIMLRCELEAIGIPLETKEKWKIGERRFQLDIVIPSWSLIIEFDGYRWHSGKKNVEKDQAKSQYLRNHGWQVIRIRDRLELTHPNDCRVDSSRPIFEIVASLIKKLRSLGYTHPNFAKYLSQRERWGEKTANKAIAINLRQSLANSYPRLAAEFDRSKSNGLLPESLHPRSASKVPWRCSSCGHSWWATVVARVGSGSSVGTGCPKCAIQRGADKRRSPKPNQSLADQYPALSSEWDTEKNVEDPGSVRPGTELKVWWICPLGHSYQARIISRTRNRTGCPVCDGKKVLKGFNDLATTRPDLLEYWNYSKNASEGLYPTDVMAGTDKHAHWKCQRCGEEKYTKIYSVSQGRSCRSCSRKNNVNRRMSAPLNESLAIKKPNLLEDWDFEANKAKGLDPYTLFPQSHRRASWRCHICGHKWESKIQGRALGNACPRARRRDHGH